MSARIGELGMTAELAQFASRLGGAELPVPGAVRERIGLHLLDTIAVAAAGSMADSSPAVRQGLRALAAQPGPCTVIAESSRLPPEHAAFLNGTWAHSLDFDDTTLGAALHPGAPVVPAVLALAEAHGREGTDVLNAIAVGYEVMCRVGLAMGTVPYDRGFHPTAISGVFGASAALANLLDLDAKECESALGLAGSMAAGSMQYLEDGTHNKRLHPGLAARNAILASLLAQHGVAGAGAALEGRRGAFHSFGRDDDAPSACKDLGSKWHLLSTGIKPYPGCRLTHGAIDAALMLRVEAPEVCQSIERMTIALHPRAFDLVGRPDAVKRRPSTTVDGQFSVWFLTSVALLEGAPTWQCYERIGEDRVHEIIDRTTVMIDESLPVAGATIEIVGAGRVVSQRVEIPSGEPGEGLNPDVVVNKFHSATEPIWTQSRREDIVSFALDIEEPGMFMTLCRALQSQS